MEFFPSRKGQDYFYIQSGPSRPLCKAYCVTFFFNWGTLKSMYQGQHVAYRSMIAGGSWVYQELLKMYLSECCSLFYKDNHSYFNLAVNNNLFPFSIHFFFIFYSAHWQWEENIIVIYKLSIDTFQGIFSNTYKREKYKSFVCRTIWDHKPLHWIISILGAISSLP